MFSLLEITLTGCGSMLGSGHCGPAALLQRIQLSAELLALGAVAHGLIAFDAVLQHHDGVEVVLRRHFSSML